MVYAAAVFGAVAILPIVRGIAFGGPAPTPAATNADRAVNGWTPKPTRGPSAIELRKRDSNLFPETCGWVDGDYSSAVTCGLGRTCMLYTASAIGMAGCCSGGSDTQECGWMNSCVDYDAYTASSCDSDCLSNSFVRKCSDSASPYCVTWTYPYDEVADYGCASVYIGIETVLQTALDDSDSYTTSMSLPTVSGLAVTGWDGESSASDTETTSDPTDFFTSDAESTSDLSDFFTDPSTTAESTDVAEPTSGFAGGSSSKTKKKKKVSVGLIAGAVIGGLVLLFLIGAAVIFFCVKKKKSKQLAANQEAIAAAQASRPQSQFPPQPQMQQQYAGAPMSPQMPQHNGYFAPPGQQDQKLRPQSQINDYGHSPISSPASPAPAYVQPYYAPPNAAPIPSQSPVAYPVSAPTPGSHEVDAISVAQAPPAPGQHGGVYEMGPGR